MSQDPQASTEEQKEEKPKLFLDEPTGEMVSKNELKKRKKMRDRDAKKKAKEEAKKKKEEEKKAEGGTPALTVGDDQELDPTKYTENRKNWI